MVKVLVHGFGTIGKRVAHAIYLQKDLKLYGICNRSVNANVRNMLGNRGPLKKVRLFLTSDKENGDFKINGNLEDALNKVDVVVDCTPAGVEESYKNIYEKYGVKMIFQGGAKEKIADLSFNADVNYEKARNVNSLRVVSCNTTSLIRTIHALEDFGIEEVIASLVRRAVDPNDDRKGPVNSIVPVVETPSHHGPDVKSVMPWINITTMASKVPVTLTHLHMITAKLKKKIGDDEILNAFENGNRILLFDSKQGYSSTALIMEHFRDINRPRGDMYEVAVWKDSVKVENKRVYWIHAVHSEAIVIPENVDAIRALFDLSSKEESIKRTNESLGIP